MSFVTETVLPLLRAIQHRKSPDFAGIGVIFYTAPMALPVLSLGDLDTFPVSLPVIGQDAIAKALAQISARTSPWHDGFHLIDSSTIGLTHPSQFVSPPLAEVGRELAKAHVMGARQMTAVLVSDIPSVKCVALLNTNGDALVYQHGHRILIKDLKQ